MKLKIFIVFVSCIICTMMLMHITTNKNEYKYSYMESYELTGYINKLKDTLYPELPDIKCAYGDLSNDDAIGLFALDKYNEPIIIVDYSIMNDYKINVLAHELIHYKLYVNNIDDNHDEPFINEMNYLNEKFNLNIQVNGPNIKNPYINLFK